MEVNRDFARRISMAKRKIMDKIIEVTCKLAPKTRVEMSDRVYEVQQNGEWRRVA